MLTQQNPWQPWNAMLGFFLIVIVVNGAAHAQFRGPSEPQTKKRGATKNVAVELYKVKGDVHRKITALQGVEFAVRELSANDPTSGLTFKDSNGKPVDFVVPGFSPGDSRITIRIDPTVGFTEIFGLQILDPAVVNYFDV